MAPPCKGALSALCLLALALCAAAGAPPANFRLAASISAMEAAMAQFRESPGADISLAATNNTDYIPISETSTSGRYSERTKTRAPARRAGRRLSPCARGSGRAAAPRTRPP